MNIWILQTGEPLQTDGGNPRPMRAMNLSNILVERGNNVTIWSSAFFHQTKLHRSKVYEEIIVSDKLEIKLIPSPGYKKNIGLGRLYDHTIMAFNLKKILHDYVDLAPDIVIIGYPPIETSWIMARWLCSRKIPYIVDLKDQWPSLFLEGFSPKFRPIVRLFLTPYYIMAREILLSAKSFTSMSDSYLSWMSSFSGRKLTKNDRAFPLTSSIFEIIDSEVQIAKNWWLNVGVETTHNRRFVFIGSFMSVFDFSLIYEAASKFQTENINCQFVLCGTGGCLEEVKSLMSGLDNVIFPGWIDLSKIDFLAKYSRASLIPYKSIENFTLNIPNKVVDALAYGLPIVTSLKGVVQDLVIERSLGFACNSTTGMTMYEALILLLKDNNLQEICSNNARKLYEESFYFDKVYGEFADFIE